MKRSLAVFALLAAGIVAVSAQALQTPVKSDVKIIAMDMGTGFAYNLDTQDTSPIQTVSTVYNLTDIFQVGLDINKGNAATFNSTLLKLSAFPMSGLAVNLYMGQDGSNAFLSGLGASYNIFSNSMNGLTTILKVHAEYIFNDISKGNLGFGLSMRVGI